MNLQLAVYWVLLSVPSTPTMISVWYGASLGAYPGRVRARTRRCLHPHRRTAVVAAETAKYVVAGTGAERVRARAAFETFDVGVRVADGLAAVRFRSAQHDANTPEPA